MFEIEKKALIGACKTKLNLHNVFDFITQDKVDTESQLNHYFTNTGDLYRVVQLFNLDIPANQLEKVIKQGYSLRTRSINNGNGILIIKIKADKTSAENGVARQEIELQTSKTIDSLDQSLLSEGYYYLSKWSRERQSAKIGDFTYCLDKNAGYGYLVEVEKLVENDNEIDQAKNEIDQIFADSGLVELPEDRLQRMFEHYNQNWRDYYGTDNVFNID